MEEGGSIITAATKDEGEKMQLELESNNQYLLTLDFVNMKWTVAEIEE